MSDRGDGAEVGHGKIRNLSIIYLAMGGFLCGVGGGEYLASHGTVLVVVRIFAFAPVVMGVLWMWRGRRGALAVLVFFIAACVGGVVYGHDLVARIEARLIAERLVALKQRTLIEGVLASSPKAQASGMVQYVIARPKINDQRLDGDVQLMVMRGQAARAGDLVRVRATLQVPKNTDYFPTYRTYLETQDIFLVARAAQSEPLEVVRAAPWWSWRREIEMLNQSLMRIIQRALPEPHAQFLAAMLIGARDALPQSLTDDFRRTGLTHIIAVSGFNITIVVQAAEFVVRRVMKRAHGFWLLCGCVMVFVVLTGAQASVMRAGLMALLTLVAARLGRRTQAIRSLLMVGCALVAMRPLMLLHDIGFQLSFAATAGVMLIPDSLERVMRWIPERWGLRETLTLFCAAQVATLPISLFHFGGISLVAPVANVLALPLIPIIMLCGGVLLGVGAITPVLGQAVGGVTWVLLELELRLIDLCAHAPGAFVVTKTISATALAAWYALVGSAIFFYQRRKEKPYD